MVSILPGESNWDRIGQAIGQNLGQTVPGAAQQGFQRQTGLNAVDTLQKELEQAGNDPTKMLAALARGITVNPQLARAGLEKLAISKAASAGGIGEPGTNTQPDSAPKQGEIQPQQQTIKNANSLLQKAQQEYPDLPPPEYQPEVFGGDLEPATLGQGPIPAQYSPKQIADQRSADLQAGFLESPKADLMENYNQNARQEYNDYVQAANNHSTFANLRRQSQEAFRNELQTQTGIKDPADLAVAESIAESPIFKNIKNDKIRAQKVADAFNQYQAAKNSFDESSVRPNFLSQDYNRDLETLQNRVEPFRKYGQIDKARAILAKNGWSETEQERILNPLDKSTLEAMKKLPDVMGHLRKFANIPGFEFTPEIEKENNRNLRVWEDFLGKAIKPGKIDPKNPQVFTPGTSLIEIARYADKAGMPTNQLSLIINRLRDEKRIDLDDQQNNQVNKISQGLSRLKSLGELLFGE